MSETHDNDPGEADADDAIAVNELAALRAVRPSGDAFLANVQWDQPPDDLWQRIAAEAGVEPVAQPSTGASVVSMADRRRRRWAVPLTVAAAAVLIGVVATVIVTRGDGSDQVVAAVQLDRLAGTGSGSAEMVNHDGHMQLHLHTTGLDAGDGYVEVWLIDPTVSKLVSLGPLTDDGVYDVPATVDPTEFPIVDVSAEPVDGNPAHSGASLLRGQLPFPSA